MSDKYAETISVGDTSEGNVRMTYITPSGYDKTVWMDEKKAKYLFNRLGRILGDSPRVGR